MKKYLTEKYNWFKNNANLRKALLIIILTACVFEFISIKVEKRKLNDTFSEYRYNWKEVRKNESTPDLADIQPWMTFSYLNFIFKLPKDYLENSLNIDTKKYPNISIQRYAKLYDLDINNFISKLKIDIGNYNLSNRP